MRLDAIERYYDAVPRPVATTEEVGPFTLFLAEEGTGWDFYARPRLGETRFTADDVRRVLDRQTELGKPHAIEWVDEVTPELWPAVAAAGEKAGRYPLLALADDAQVIAPDGAYEVLAGDDPRLGEVGAAVHAAYGGTDEIGEPQVGKRPQLIEAGQLVVVGAWDEHGPVGGGSSAPRGHEYAELMGIAVLPRARRQGHGSALTRTLAAYLLAHDTRPFLSAEDDAAAAIYRRVGFTDVGTACILGD